MPHERIADQRVDLPQVSLEYVLLGLYSLLLDQFWT